MILLKNVILCWNVILLNNVILQTTLHVYCQIHVTHFDPSYDPFQPVLVHLYLSYDPFWPVLHAAKNQKCIFCVAWRKETFTQRIMTIVGLKHSTHRRWIDSKNTSHTFEGHSKLVGALEGLLLKGIRLIRSIVLEDIERLQLSTPQWIGWFLTDSQGIIEVSSKFLMDEITIRRTQRVRFVPYLARWFNASRCCFWMPEDSFSHPQGIIDEAPVGDSR